MITPHHARYFAHSLSIRSAEGMVDRLSQSLYDAGVDLNPHQIEAALFALDNPLAQGVILADEVGLGKTIEAGLVLCQLWAERRRTLLVVCPASLRKQWALELHEKFHLPSQILEATALRKLGTAGALDRHAGSRVVILSYQAAVRLEAEIRAQAWDLAVLDEAHKLRNAHKETNRIGQSLRRALEGRRRILLTATPLQNSLMELYGLSTMLDESLFGDESLFRRRYISQTGNTGELQTRLRGFVRRTLRKQVQEYIKYTRRLAITQSFLPRDDEQALYESVAAFIARENTLALPRRQRHLTGLILRKLLASSPRALVGTLETIKARLQSMLEGKPVPDSDSLAAELVQGEEMGEDLLEEAGAAESGPEEPQADPVPNAAQIKEEVALLGGFIAAAGQLQSDTKAQALLTALRTGFQKMEELEAPRKAVIFTESRRTQDYLAAFLAANGHAGRVVVFNGTNTGPEPTAIYQDWLKEHKGTLRWDGNPAVDRRTALLDYFREQADILIATEAGAEGVNLQFCALVINYDLPWNPQRIEQRIGRCHRYGQRHDVAVINFLNERNHADRRVLDLLSDKFHLFTGVFGASDEVLGRIESGLDFERRVQQIVETCRTPEAIDAAFAQLQSELDEPITSRLKETQSLLMERFDEEVHERLRLSMKAAEERMDRLGRWFWLLTCKVLEGRARFEKGRHVFELATPPAPEIENGRYQLVRGAAAPDLFAMPYRLGSSLGGWVIAAGLALEAPIARVVFGPSGFPSPTGQRTRLVQVEALAGRSGWLRLDRLAVETATLAEFLVFTGLMDDGTALDQEACERLMQAEAVRVEPATAPPPESLDAHARRREDAKLAALQESGRALVSEESGRLDRWADDRIQAAESALDDAKERIAQTKREIRLAESLAGQAELQARLKEQEGLLRRLRQEIFKVEDEIMTQRDQLIERIHQRMRQRTESSTVLVIQWAVQ